MTDREKCNTDEMNDEEFTDYFVEMLVNRNIKLFEYESFDNEDELITKTRFIANNGWEVSKRDVWQQ